MISQGLIHYTIIRKIIDDGFAPSAADLAQILQTDAETIIQQLYQLQDDHGVVLHPNEPKIWIIHPFSLAPTNFYVTSESGAWWGNCAWCSLGIAVLLNQDLKITTTIGAQTRQIDIHIVNGEIQEKNLFIHFPIRMMDAWNNVVYTCSNMLVFENEGQIDEWVAKHNIPKGDMQPIEKIWQFSKKWYGNHLHPNWTKWTISEAQDMFEEFDLTGHIWHLNSSDDRF